MSAAAAPAVNNRLKFEGSDAFHKAVKARVDRYFRATGAVRATAGRCT